MTLIDRVLVGKPFLLIGASGALLATVLMAVAPYCMSSAHLQVASLVTVLDFAACLSILRGVALPLSLVALLATGTTVLMVGSCAPPGLGAPTPLVEQGFAWSILVGSRPFSLVGALLRRSGR